MHVTWTVDLLFKRARRKCPFLALKGAPGCQEDGTYVEYVEVIIREMHASVAFGAKRRAVNYEIFRDGG